MSGLTDFVNDRAVLLRTTVPRNINPRAAKFLQIDPDTTFFHVTADGVASPAVVTLNVRLVNIPGVASISVIGGDANAVLTGTTDNVRALAYGDVHANMVTIEARITYEGQLYVDKKNIAKVFDGAKGDAGMPADMSADALKEALANQLTANELEAALRARIDLIDAPDATAGSVNARVKAETDARVTAIQGEANARVAYTQTWAYSKAEVDSSEAALVASVTANYTAYADAARSSAISTAAADVRSYTYSKANTDSAIAASADELRSEFVSSGGATEAYVQGYAYSKSAVDASEAAQTSAITASYQSYADTKKSEAITVAAADVRSYGYAKAAVDSAIASSTSTLSARLDNVSGTGVTVEQKFTAQANTLTGLSAQVTWKIDNNGHMTGIGLASDAPTGTPTGAVVILADMFRMVAPGAGSGAPSTQVFDIQVVGGVAKAIFAGDFNASGGSFKWVHVVDNASGGAISGGGHSAAYAWPTTTTGGVYDNGFHLSSRGLLLGNAYNGKYCEIDDKGNIYTPGFRCVDAVFEILQQVVTTPNIVNDAITTADVFSDIGASTEFTCRVPSKVLISAICAINTSGSSSAAGYSLQTMYDDPVHPEYYIWSTIGASNSADGGSQTCVFMIGDPNYRYRLIANAPTYSDAPVTNVVILKIKK